jgi:hypothetical protein
LRKTFKAFVSAKLSAATGRRTPIRTLQKR